MCGIVGAFTFDAFEKKSEEKARTEANIFITTQLLQETVDRGKDATGISLLWADGNYTGLKMGIPSPDFIARFGTTEKDFEGILKLWREYPKLMKIFIGHCRKSSVGNSYDNKNNHPIQIGDIIMCHNGTLTNHEKIFDKLKCNRTGDVDSEAIGRLLHHYTNGGVEPFTVEMIKETSRRLHGSYSVLAMSGNNPYQVAQFRDGRPAEMVLVRPLKMVFVASEKKFLEKVLFEYNKTAKLFAPTAKLPYLRQADVQFKMLQDDSLALWDLTTPIDDKTDIEDLYTWEKVPLRVDKVWGTTTTYNSGVNNTQKKSTTSGQTGKGTEVTAKNTNKGTAGNTAGDADGLVWSKSLSKYKTQAGIDKSKQIGAVVIDVEKGKVDVLDDSPSSPIELKEVESDQVENLIVGGAAVEELALNAAEEVVEDKKNPSAKPTDTGADDESKISNSSVEIEMSQDPEAIKKAEEAIENGLTKYENDGEVASDLDITDATILRTLPLYALANRVKKFIWKVGFIAGYTARKEEGKVGIQLGEKIVPLAKLEAAENKIRVTKMVLKIMAESLALRCKGNSSDGVMSMIEAALKEVSNGKTVKADLSTVFTVGDLKNVPMLKEIKEKLEAK